MDLTLLGDQRWNVKFNIYTSHWGWLISDQCHVGVRWLLQLSLKCDGGLAPIRWSKQCGIDILPMFLLRLGSNLQMHMASFASHVIWKGSLLITLKLETNGKGWWKSVLSIPYVKAEPQWGHCMSVLTAHPCSLKISPSFCTFPHTCIRYSTDYNKGWTDSTQWHTHLIYLYRDIVAVVNQLFLWQKH